MNEEEKKDSIKNHQKNEGTFLIYYLTLQFLELRNNSLLRDKNASNMMYLHISD